MPKWKILGSVTPERLSEPGNGLTGRTYFWITTQTCTFEFSAKENPIRESVDKTPVADAFDSALRVGATGFFLDRGSNVGHSVDIDPLA
jgi:hypothetical protein